MYRNCVVKTALKASRLQYNFQLLNTVNIRRISALHITGDKARENYVTIQPYLDFKGTFANSESLESSLRKRKIPTDLQHVKNLYEKYKKAVESIDKVDDEREMIAKQLKELSKTKDADEDIAKKLKERGKELRNDMKSMKSNLYPVEDEFFQAFLHLPNVLHSQCPDGDFERLLYRNKIQQKCTDANSHIENKRLVRFVDKSRYYLLNEAAEFDLKCTDALTKYIREKGNFIHTSNPDFVRCVLLEANATPIENYHKVMEHQLQNKLNCAYLTGGGAFESFLGAVTKLCIYPSVVPLKYVCSGRLYEKTDDKEKSTLFTATQTNAVQTFVATLNPQQSEEQMDAILNLCVDFYKLFDNLQFRIVYVKAADLSPAESLRAQIEVYSTHEKRYVCVGRVSNYTDYVSKRILFTMREQKEYKFLHLVGGPILYTTRLLAALIENGGSLDAKRITDLLMPPSNINTSNKAIGEFQSLFK
ncbi:seryl-tRNA synthetase-like insect mitochondrial protein [Haematobia irritans]|uniref:seryl-tRNA synthetase-like insect mitochondrial protein n=1 Tax=Haematobia irritans TaxID=7368 RepID=UPI003F4F7CA3